MVWLCGDQLPYHTDIARRTVPARAVLYGLGDGVCGTCDGARVTVSATLTPRRAGPMWSRSGQLA